MNAEVKHPPVQPPPGAALLTIPEAAHELRCSVATVYREIGGGKLTTRKIRGKTLIHRDDIKAYLDAARRESSSLTAGETPAVPTRERVSLRAAGLIDDDVANLEYKRPSRKKPRG